MTTCEQMQVAHEMWAHGVQASIDPGDIERHASGCDACRAYVAQSRKIDTMTALTAPTFDFAQLRTRIIGEVPKARRTLYLVVAMYGVVVLSALGQGAFNTVVIMTVLGVIAFKKAARRIDALVGAGSADQSDQLAAWRTDLQTQLDDYRFLMPWMPVMFLVALGFSIAGHVDMMIVAAVMIPLTLYSFADRKKLRAELARWH